MAKQNHDLILRKDAAASGTTGRNGVSSAVKILLLEDNDADARLIFEYLKEPGFLPFELKRVTHLSEALQKIAEERCDVILSDLDLVDSRGLDTLWAVVQASPQVPVVVLTGFDDEKLGIDALQKGAQDYLVKGKIQSDVLIRSIRYAVERKKKEVLSAQLELEKTKRLSDIGVLAATVAHELRNPLATINMAAYNIRRKSKNADLEKHLASIDLKVAESNQIINNLLSYSRIKTPNYDDIKIFELIEECLAAATEIHRQKKVSFVRKIDGVKGITIRADIIQLKEVINNLLNNACDAFGPQGGMVEILSVSQDGFIHIVVKDNGHGIDKENMNKVFDPFFTTKANGTGLGLSVCQQIVHIHNGSIALESEPGHGTAVTVRLPAKASP